MLRRDKYARSRVDGSTAAEASDSCRSNGDLATNLRRSAIRQLGTAVTRRQAAQGSNGAARAVPLRLQAGDLVDVDFDDVRRMRTFARIEELTIDGDRPMRRLRHRVAHVPAFRARQAVIGGPINGVVNRADAALRRSAFGVDAERDAELVLVEAHDDGLLSQRHGTGGGRSRSSRSCGANGDESNGAKYLGYGHRNLLGG